MSTFTIPAPPTTLSALLRMAMDDYYVIKETPGYVIDMRRWHKWKDDICYVCLAGCVMANTLKLAREDGGEHLVCNSPWTKALDAVNSLRTGNLWMAAVHLRVDQLLPNYDVASYDRTPRLWEHHMEQLYTDLVEAEVNYEKAVAM